MTKRATGFSVGSFAALISDFVTSGYSLTRFTAKSDKDTKAPRLFLRHDVDIDLNAALTMARFEKLQGFQATYFFLLRCPFYNLLGERAETIVNQIHDCGHDVALHIDLSIYKEGYEHAVLREVDCLLKFFPYANSKIFSVHRPATISPDKKISIQNLENVSSRTLYARPVDYVSDSTGAWRRGHPLDRNAFRTRQDIQLLTHPIWWTSKGTTPKEKLENSIAGDYSNTMALLKQHLPALFNQE